ncbi:MAG TPA: M48 family metallopeptidase, partial [Usitatibacteraceae bacterium]|nr:M48 family metallopeptidase [Usitatibacteraceae bacterium]
MKTPSAFLILPFLMLAGAACAADPGPALEAHAATQAYMDRLSGAARASSDAYFEGKTWLLLWNALYGLAVAWLLLASGTSAKIRDAIERRLARANLRVFAFALVYFLLVALLSLPLTVYAEYLREHQYGLSNMTFAAWLGQFCIALLVDMALSAVAITGFYAFLRRTPRTWWAWGTLAGGGFIVLMIMISPVFIAPLFNTYQPLPHGPLRDDILAMARANGIPAENVYWFDASKQSKRISANVSGLFGTTRIALNDNLLNRTSPAEIRAVMAHEMGHYVLNHGVKHSVAFTLLLLGGLLFIRAGWAFASARWGTRFGVRGIDDVAGLPLVGALFSVWLLIITPVFNTVIRSAETEADLFGLNAAREPDGFAEAIFKLAEYRKLQPGALEEVLFFDHPSGYNRIFAA